MRQAERERRRRVYRAWAAGHSPEQAAAVATTAVILGTMPNPPFTVSVLTRVLQRVAADLAAAAGEQHVPPGAPDHDWGMPHDVRYHGHIDGCPDRCPRRRWVLSHA